MHCTKMTTAPTPSKDGTGKTFMLDDDDEAAIVIEADDLVVEDLGGGGGNGSHVHAEAEHIHDQLPSVEEMKSRSSIDPSVVAANRSRQRKRCLMGFGVIVLVSLLVVAIVVPLKNKNQKNSNSQSYELQGRFEQVAQFLYANDISPLPALEDKHMNEHRAALFVADGDMYQAELTESNMHRFVERYVLALIYYSTNGPEWTNNYKFLSARDHCEWFTTQTRPAGTILKGVKCNEDGFVTGLDLSENNLVGNRFPEEIKWLRQLEALHIQKNDIGGQIPRGISKLPKLKSIGMMEMKLSGSFPDFFGEMTQLTTLAISRNSIHGTIPATLSKLTDMRILGLDGNELTGSMSPIKKMSNLEALYLEENTFTGQIEGASWGKLKELDVSQNMLDGTIPSTLLQNQNLIVLDVGNNLFYGDFPGDILQNDSLEYLSFHRNGLTGTLSDRIGFLSNLKHLDVGSNDLTGTLPDTVQELSNMIYLYTSGNSFDAQPLHSMDLTKMTNLRDLSMKGNHLTGTLPDWFGEMSTMQMLDLDGNKLSGTIPTWYGLMADLDHLLLNRNMISGTIPSQLSNLKHLRVLLLDGNNLTGSAQGICESSNPKLAHFIADCYPGPNGERPEVECRCCTLCCTDGDPNCNNKQWTANFDPKYFYGYVRPSYSFSLDDATTTEWSKDVLADDSN